MRFVKRKQKFLAVFFLLIMVSSILQPVATYALTTGPHQPEYTSYEQPGSTDMVNLLTGDFTFSLPILEVPGPEGNFSVPLTYNAGIGLEQEASWVGLGWTLNAGAITRQINQYPDDASGEPQNILNVNLHSIHGWTSAALGLGSIGWNNVQGNYGSVSILGIIQFGYDRNGVTSGGILGIGGKNGSFDFDPVQFSIGAMTIVTFGAASAVEGATAVAASSVAKQVVMQTVENLAVGAALSAAFPSETPTINPSAGLWAYNKKHEDQSFFHKDYWIWLDDTRQENMYGIFNLDRAPLSASVLRNYWKQTGTCPNCSYSLATSCDNQQINGVSSNPNAYYYDLANTGATSDINYYIPSGTAYKDAQSPASLATDNFAVHGPGISGTIRPYRLDVGSVSMPLAMNEFHIRYNLLPFANYKVPFIYEGTSSSSYLNQTGGSGINFNFGLDLNNVAGVSHIYDTSTPNQGQGYILPPVSIDEGTFTLTDVNFDFQKRIRSDIKSNQYKIPQANHVEWFSNAEVIDATAFRNNFMDYFTSTSNPTRVAFRSSYPFQLPNIANDKKKPKSIAGYSITGVNGLTYHFALPSYDYNFFTRVSDKIDPNSAYTMVNWSDPFANTWLLTGITGPDFIDRNADGAIDDADWGYWVKFNYGKYADNYSWMIPYNSDLIDSENTSFTHSSGVKQLYYLNSIETRSHVAIFIKDYRSDNKDQSKTTGTLKLNEIALLKREDYKKLFSTYGQSNDSGAIGSLWLSSNFYSGSGANPAVGDFIIQNASKRIKFSYNYNLCPGTLNSDAPNHGKLTLNRISIVGRNNFQVVPDYKFDYGFDPANNSQIPPNYTLNPSYNANQWDAWGMYNPLGTAAYNTHNGSQNDADGAAWSLSRVTSPQGTTLDVNYERDKYGSVSEFPTLGTPVTFSFGTYIDPRQGTNNIVTTDLNGNFDVGDNVYIKGTLTGTCTSASPNQPISSNFSASLTVLSIASNGGNTKTVTLSDYFGSIYCVGNQSLTYVGTVQKNKAPINGDGLRVGSIIIRDQDRLYKTRYLYVNADGTCSGVIAQEPGYARTTSFDFNNLPGYPITPVIYGSVSVLTGNLSTDTDFNTKYVYEFETPRTNMISLNNDRVQFNSSISSMGSSLLKLNNQVSDLTSMIGAIKSVKVYDKNGIVSSTAMTYTSQLLNSGGINQYQGYYSSSILMHDKIFESLFAFGNMKSSYKINRSTTIKYPYVLQSVVNQKYGATSRTDNIAWDYITGQVVEKNSVSSTGYKTKAVTQPAYSFYSQMGPKAYDPTNKNMLSQSAGEYVYSLDGSGKIYGLISGQATTWSNSWNNYRDFDSPSNSFVEGVGTPPTSVWRKSKTYVYKGGIGDVQGDGSLRINSSNKFDYSGVTNTNWQQTNEITRFDHFSLPLESKDIISGIYSSVKTDFNNKFILASASNAKYLEFAYSGAEDGDNTSAFFGGEVARKSGSVVSTPVHTGVSSLSVPTGGYGYVFKSNGILANRSYKASVWTSDSTNGKLYYNNGTEVLPKPTVSQAITLPNGTWYRLDIIIPAGNTSIEVGVKSMSGTVFFDDFRFQPTDAVLTCKVYNPNTLNLEYFLDNNNTYSRYEYNKAGNVIKTYIESMKPGYIGEKLLTETRYDYKRFHVDQ